MILAEINLETSKIELLNNNHFQFIGEVLDPEALMSCRVHNIKEKGHYQGYIDISFFSEKPNAWPFGNLPTLLQEKTEPAQISDQCARIPVGTETLDVQFC